LNGSDLGPALRESIERQTRGVRAQPDVDELLTRLDRRRRHRRAALAVVVVVALVFSAFLGYALKGRVGTPATPHVDTFAGQGPAQPAPGVSFEPRDATAARAAVVQAFADALDGGVPTTRRDRATEDAVSLRRLRAEATAYAETHGYTRDQLSGTTVVVLGTTFVDNRHAIVRFSLAIPGHGTVLVDRVGYAVRNGDHWQVTVSTSCDLLSIAGLLQPCPAAR
jgi:hypothetical protein